MSAKSNYLTDSKDEEQQEAVNDFGALEIDSLNAFKSLLSRLLSLDSMYSKRSMLQSMVDNEQGWNLETMKEAFGAVILK